LDDGGRLSEAQARFEVYHLRFTISDLIKLEKNNRYRGNLVDLMTNQQIRGFMQYTEDIRDNQTNNRIFVAMKDLNANDLQAANTQGINNSNAIFIFHKGNYRPLHAYNSLYLNRVLSSISNA
jgi:hypothetical protein